MGDTGIRYPLTTALVALAALANGIAAATGGGGWPTRRALEHAHAELVRENRAARLANRALVEDLEVVAEDPEVVEWLARTRLGYVRDGEQIYRFEVTQDPR